MLPDGTLLEAGRLDSALLSPQGFESVAFGAPFEAAPVVLSQVQSANDPDFTTTRQRNADADGFEVTMQEEQALNAGMDSTETIGWLAIEAGRGTAGDIAWTAGRAGGVTDAGTTIALGAGLTGGANVIAGLSSFAGADPAWARGDGSTATGFTVSAEEDTSADPETAHTAETVDYLAFDQSGLITAYDYDLFA
jgi:hypothetical protein